MGKDIPNFLSDEDLKLLDAAASETAKRTQECWIKEGNTLGLSRAEFEAQYGLGQVPMVNPVEKS